MIRFLFFETMRSNINDCVRTRSNLVVLLISFIGLSYSIIVFGGLVFLFGLRSPYPWICISPLFIDVTVAVASHYSLPRLIFICQILLTICFIGIIITLILIVPDLTSQKNNSNNNSTITSTTTTTTTPRTRSMRRSKKQATNPAEWVPLATSALLFYHAIFWLIADQRRREILRTATIDPVITTGIPLQLMVHPKQIN